MIHMCITCFWWILCFFVAADASAFKNDLEAFEFAEHDTLRMFEDFSSTFHKNYRSRDEYRKRFTVFKHNLKIIDQLNREEEGTAKYGITRFADLTYEEFVRNFTGSRISAEEWERHESGTEEEREVEIEFLGDNYEEGMEEEIVSSKEMEEEEDDEEDDVIVIGGTVFLPKKYDYRKKKAVTPVKDQGDCGACWAFSAIANVEGVWAKSKKKLINLSEQELLDCNAKFFGCGGGYPQPAIDELMRLGGVAETSVYPYTGIGNSFCVFNQSTAVVKVAGTKSVPANEKKMARSLVKHGPLSIVLEASQNFQFYKEGIFNPTRSQCSTNKDLVNHAVAIVGYGEEVTSKNDKLPFWVIKNSWGTSWGEKGYIRIVRGKNACALTSYVSTAYL